MELGTSMNLNDAVLKYRIRPRQKRLAYNTLVHPSITSPIKSNTMNLRYLESIHGPMVPMICHGLMMHCHAKHAYVFGPTRYGGMEVHIG